MVCRTGDCWVAGGVGNAAPDAGVGCGVRVFVMGCSATVFGAGLAAGAGGPAGRRRGGALGAAFLPDVAELMSVDMTSGTRQH
jgi:hypothetical protein